MDDLLGVQVLHAGTDLPGPAHHLRGEDLNPSTDIVVESATTAVLQHHTVARGLCANTTAGEKDVAYGGLLKRTGTQNRKQTLHAFFQYRPRGHSKGVPATSTSASQFTSPPQC